MGRNQTLPLENNQLEVEEVDQNQTAPNAEVVEYLGPAGPVEVAKDGIVKVRLVTHVDNAEVAGVEAEESGEEDDYEAE